MCTDFLIVTVTNIILIANDTLFGVHADSFPMHCMLRIYEAFNMLFVVDISKSSVSQLHVRDLVYIFA